MFKWVKKAKKLFNSNTSDGALVHIDDDGFMSDDISVSIEEIVNDESLGEDLGKLHVLSLTEFHTALGESWDSREDKIFMLTEGVLRDMIGPGNHWEKRSNEIYIMLFPKLSDVQGDIRAFDIAEQVGFKIIGERFEGGKRPHARIAGVDPKDALDEDGTFNLAKLEEVGRSGKSAGGEAGEDEDPETPNEGDPDDLDWKKKRHDSEEHDTDWRKNRHDGEEANTDWKKRHLQNGDEVDPDWEKLEREKKEKEDPQWVQISKADEQKTTKQKPTKAASRFGLTFGPCWDRSSQSLHIYRALLTFMRPDGAESVGSAAYQGAKSDEQRFKLDHWVLNNAAKALTAFKAKKISAPLFIPVASSTLRGEFADKYIDFVGKIGHDLRRNSFVLEIIDDGKWDQKDLDKVLKPFSQLVFGTAFQLSPQGRFNPPQDTAKIKWIGLDLSSLDEENAVSPDELGNLINTHDHTYIFGLKQRDQISELIDMGVTLIQGPALVKNTKVLRPPFKLPIERLKK